MSKRVPEYYKHKFNKGAWEWWDIETDAWSTPILTALEEEMPETGAWLEVIQEAESNYLSVHYLDGRDPMLFGTLQYSVKESLTSNYSASMFHFFVHGRRLVTLNLDQRTRMFMSSEDRMRMLDECGSGADGLFVLVRILLHYFQNGMDHFELNLRPLEESMKKKNARTLMDKILDSRFELLYWSNMFVPFQELISASREAYLDALDDNPFFQRMLYRVERMQRLFEHYEREIDTLISIDNAISGFRGNEITKTLTIVTAVFTPATVVGAIWGMNFENLPWIKTPWGFTVVMITTLISMAGMYIWMRKKGFTGDLLRAGKKERNI
ncbi:magnesium transporter CorA family protein [Paenibacillus medicaginis]|uniref:Magnesium transporter CorA family protein n=1 Tax=Paenibacillus medicaginis TaxID=1470560 RepID=A0ABV5C9G8_9BACL